MQYAIAQLTNVNIPCLAILAPTQTPTSVSASQSVPTSDHESNPAPMAEEQANLSQSAPSYGVALILRRDAQRLLVLQPK